MSGTWGRVGDRDENGVEEQLLKKFVRPSLGGDKLSQKARITQVRVSENGKGTGP